MPTAAISRYWVSLENECVCGRPSEQVHHIIHVNGQRITKDDWLVVKLCDACHRDLHAQGGDRQFGSIIGVDLVHLATLRRHNYEVRAR